MMRHEVLMRGLRWLFNQIMRRVRRPPSGIEQKLQGQALEAALKEARLLRERHAVEVKSLVQDEEPGPPRRADQA